MTLTEDEEYIIDKLGEVWNLYLMLPIQHEMEQDEFCRAMHRVQDIVASRPTYRYLSEKHEIKTK